MFNWLRGLFKSDLGVNNLVAEINAFEHELKKLSADDFKKRTGELRSSLKSGKSLDDILPEAFALVREASRRTLGQRHFDTQLMGGIVLHRGAIAEMLTGEGKTLTATLAVYLNALSGDGAHVITVNDYLARRDAVWMGQIYNLLGLSVSCLVHEGALLYDPTWHVPEEDQALIDRERDTTGSFLVQKEFLKPTSRRDAYLADITYGTNHEFGFDYLRDNLESSREKQVQRGHNYAIIDEVDSILIDEARTPLIISAPDAESSELYKAFARAVRNLKAEDDYSVDEKMKSVSITDAGIEKMERTLGIKNLYGSDNIRLVHFLNESLRAQTLFQKDRDYVVRDGEIIIVDQFTGRLMLGRRFSGGLHQAIEAKEGVRVKEESRTYATITIQNYFRLYKKISGMTGTAQTSAEEFHKVYNLDVESIPSNRALVRKDESDLIYKSAKGKFQAIAKEVKERYKKGQPVLIGTVSISKNEMLSDFLNQEGIPHQILNAKNHENEGGIIAQAGKKGAVTVATNMAGRGVDIILGGNPGTPEEAREVRELGGLHVIGTERHEARRIDNQLRGRSGRQGDPGSTQFFLSMEDDLLRIFGGDRLLRLMETLKVPEDMPIQSRFVTRAVSDAQTKIEGLNFDARKHLLEFDDVLNKQRIAVYKKRQAILETINKEDLAGLVLELSQNHLGRIVQEITADPSRELWAMDALKNNLKDAGILRDDGAFDKINEELKNKGEDEAREYLNEQCSALVEEKIKEISDHPDLKRNIFGMLDLLWMNHLEMMEALSESVRLRAYAQHEPLVEYRREGHLLFKDLFVNFEAGIFSSIFKLAAKGNNASSAKPVIPVSVTSVPGVEQKAGRNDPCYCGSGKKYKKCHGK